MSSDGGSSSPSGDIYATQEQVNRLEEIILKQQTALEEFNSFKTFFNSDLKCIIEEQLQQAMTQRGSYGSDYMNITKFITKQITSAITQIKAANTDLLNEIIPVKTLQTLEKRLLAKPCFNDDIKSLAERTSVLESRLIGGGPIPDEKNISTPIANDEILNLKNHIFHLEENLLKEVQRAYKTVYKPGEYASPLAKLQAQVDILQQDIQSIKAVDGQALAEKLLSSSLSKIKEEFETQLQQKASAEDLKKYEADINRIEEFSREVQTGFYAMRSKHLHVLDDMTSRFTDEKWNKLENKLKKSVEDSVKSLEKSQENVVNRYRSELDDFFSLAKSKLKVLDYEIRNQYGPEMLEKHLHILDKALSEKYTEFSEELNNKIVKKLSGMEGEIQAMKIQTNEFTTSVKSVLDASNLQKRYDEYDATIQKQINEIDYLRKRYENQEKSHEKTLLELMNIENNIKDQLIKTESEIKGMQTNLLDYKKEIKLHLDSWLLSKNGKIQDTFRKTMDEIEGVRTNLREFLVNFNNDFEEHKQKEKYLEFQKNIREDVLTWIKEKDDYLLQRTVDIQAYAKRIVDKLQEKEEEIKTIFDKDAIQQYIYEYEERMKTLQEKWMANKSSELQIRLNAMNKQVENNLSEREAKFYAVYNKDELEKYMNTFKKSVIEQQKWVEEQSVMYKDEYNKLIAKLTLMARKAQDREDKLAKKYSEETTKIMINEAETKIRNAIQQSWDAISTEDKQKFINNLQPNKNIMKEINETIDNFKIIKGQVQEYIKSELRKYFQSKDIDELAKNLEPMDIIRLKIQLTQQANTIRPIQHDKILHEKSSQIKNTDKYYNGLSKCFYTAVFGNDGQKVDTLAPITKRIPGWDYICFTNREDIKANGWTLVKMNVGSELSNPVLEAKKYKWLSHNYLVDYDIVCWVDAYIIPNASLQCLLKQWVLNMKEKNMTILHRPHETRDCVYDECDAVIIHKRDTIEHVDKIRDILEEEHVPEHNGLVDTNIMIRFHKDKYVQKLAEEVYSLMEENTNRDQLAVPIVYYRNKFIEYEKQNLLKAFEKTGVHVRISV
jgi:hypothetical protein